MFKRILVLGASILSLAAGEMAQAILPTDNYDGQIPAPAGMTTPSYRQLDTQEAAAALPGWSAFSESRGAGWMVFQYRDDLGTPASIGGPGIPIVAAGAGNSQIDPAVRDFVAATAPILKADPDGLGSCWITPLDATRTQVILPQVYRGLDVVGGRVEVYLDQGKVVMLGSHFYPEIDLGVIPVLSSKQAETAAVGGVSFSAATDRFDREPRLVIYPLILNGAPVYFLAWEVVFTTVAPVGYWWAYVDAADGEVLTRINHAGGLDIPTTVKSDVQLNYSNDPFTEALSPDHWVAVNGTDYYTDANGFVNMQVPSPDTFPVTSAIRGRWCRAYRYAGEGPDASWSGSGTPGVPLLVKWDNTNSLTSERDVYYSANRVHKWLKEHDPNFTLMDLVVGAVVNRTDGTCNAYWDGSNINFYKEGGGCVNAATISDVVMHEYGHGITQKTYQPDQPPTASGMGEALSDIVAQTITNDHLLGRGFHNGNGYIRDGDNTRQYPGSECGNEEHCLGEILMGSMWKTRTNVLNDMGQAAGLAHYDAMMRFAWKTRQATMPDYLTKVLLGDDDNANIADGSPHWDEICAAFAVHNLDCPAITQSVVFYHTPLADQVSTEDPITVTTGAATVNCGSLVLDSLRVHYTIDAGANWSSLVLAPTGNPDEYSADIPPQPCGTVVGYYLRGVSTTGVVGTSPYRAPSKNLYRFMVGTRVLVLNDTYETDLGWTVGAPGDAATEGIWERANPVAKVLGGVTYQPEDDHTSGAGVLCYVTDARGGATFNYDVDGGATTLLSPGFDFSTASGACKLDFWAFFANTVVVDDTLRASVSNNGGATWTDLVKLSGSSLNAWNNYKVFFTSSQVPFTNQMRFRFQVADYNDSQTEALVDDIIIRRNTCPPVVDDVPDAVAPVRFAVDAARPNPTAAGATMRFALPAVGMVGVDLFDAGGRLVRTLAQGSMAAGIHSVNWDGNDASGHPVTSGMYYYQVRAGGQELTRKVLVVH